MNASATAALPMRTRRDCRLCGSRDLLRVMSLGATPLANAFVPSSQRGKPQDRFPLDVWLCLACAHVQLLDVVNPEVLFRNYVYVSGTSPVFVEHFRRYAESVRALLGLVDNDQVMEIGSNDGTLLCFFKDAGMKVLGIDPARDIAAAASAAGIPTLAEFFSLPLAKKLRAELWRPKAILANNVFAHADDLHEIVEGVAHLLDPDGVFVIEVSYLLDVFQKTLFDTIYHEHLSYHTVKPLVGLFQRHGMELIDAIRVDSHGGSLRGIAKMKGGRLPLKPGVQQLMVEEQRLGLHGTPAYAKLFADIQSRKAELSLLLNRLKSQGKRIAGFGAPAKATTLMFHFGLGPDSLEYIMDDNPLKQELYSPGNHIPVVPSSYLYDAHRPDVVLVLAWNFAESIIKKHEAFTRNGGRFIVPLPRVEVYPA